MELQIGDILLKRGTMIGSLIIRELTDGGEKFEHSYSHCAIYDGNRKIYEAFFPAVRLSELDWEDYDVLRVNLTDEEKQKLINYCESKVGIPYATIQLLQEGVEQILHIPIDIEMNGEEWCSTFVNHAFGSISKLLTRKPLSTPNDIAWSVVGELIYA